MGGGVVAMPFRYNCGSPVEMRYPLPARARATTGEAMGMKLQGMGGWGDRRAHKTAGVCGITHPPRKAAGGKAPQDRRGGLHFFGGELRCR
jgi:hypothetical protein